MKKLLSAISVFVLLVLVFTSMTLSVEAHPGRTDSNGGHTDHSTGEYHYHHGYSAHDHYDMDGDGVIDCPYDFDDQTDHNNSGAASTLPTTEPTSTPTEAPSNENESKSNTDFIAVLGWIIAVCIYIFLMFVLPFLLS